MNIPDDHGSSSFLASVPPIAFEESLVPEVLSGVKIEVPGFPTVLDPLEQSLILRYLRSRCHSWNRLWTEKYILGPGSTRNKQRPSKGSIQSYQFRETPYSDRQAGGSCQAIAIDCEMVGVRDGRQELAFLSAVDFLTGQMLISRYVVPSEEVVDWRSKFSGITKGIMYSAICSGAAFSGWREARDKLWEFMDNSTILVGQSLNYDLEVLGICHAKIVDTAILTAETVFPSVISTEPLPRMWGLKSLAKDLLSLEIQNGNCGHSALEDAYAAREVAIWCIRNPEELKLWAENARGREEECRLRKGLNRHRKGRSKNNVPASQPTRAWEYSTKHSDYSDDIRWSDFAEEFGWPEEYDPWSLRNYLGRDYGLEPACISAIHPCWSLVGIGSGIARPDEGHDIRLGDVVVSQPCGNMGGVCQYGLIKAKSDDKRERKGFLRRPPMVLLNVLGSIQADHERKDSRVSFFIQEMLKKNPKLGRGTKQNPAYTHQGFDNDRLFIVSCDHVPGPDCRGYDTADEIQRDPRDTSDPEIYHGTFASGNTIVKDAAARDRIFADLDEDCIALRWKRLA
ncbi:putative RNA exonuclease [Aspergillus affinis]|uniref:putative RNA exonuclease n=1 Tax=Aspergillus affinis TaxID=1070780 RepID=UPI0022FEC26A|nr:uncharacterized protein KD926_008381 [Aspergillus affinis]KAI9040291.1 hypothetical protein KD926_008381 [Aspergillus affinis]